MFSFTEHISATSPQTTFTSFSRDNALNCVKHRTLFSHPSHLSSEVTKLRYRLQREIFGMGVEQFIWETEGGQFAKYKRKLSSIATLARNLGSHG